MIIVEPHQIVTTPTVATIGMFDGVHRGHLSLIRQVSDIAADRGLGKSVVTFSSHPRQVLQPDYKMSLLNSFDERMMHLEDAGFDYVVVLDFTPALAQLTAREFITMLHNTYNIEVLCIGYDHRFGHNRSEGFDDYCCYGKELGMEIIQAQELDNNGCTISSSAIRKALMAGDVKEANEMLGYNYNIVGTVVGGHRIGRKMGFPTANIVPCDTCKLIPANGVYVVKATLPDGTCHGGVMNIGIRPTIQGDNSLSLETHLFDFEGDIYDFLLRVEFIDHLRDEKQFDSLDTLRQAITDDIWTARNILQYIL